MLSDAVEVATSAPRDVLSSPGATVSHTALQEAICDLLPSITDRGETIGRSLEGMLPFHRVKGTSCSLCFVESPGTVTQLELQLFDGNSNTAGTAATCTASSGPSFS
jgi:hypothetical protein